MMIDAKAVRAPWTDLGKDTPVGELLTIDDIVGKDVMPAIGIVREGGVAYVENAFVEVEAEAVGLVTVAGDGGQFAALGVEAEDVAGILLLIGLIAPRCC